MKSIRRALLVTLVMSIGTLLIVSTIAVYLSLLDEVEELFDTQLQQVAQSYPNLSHSAAIGDLPGANATDSPLKDLVVEIRRGPGQETIYRSIPGPGFPESVHHGFSTMKLDGVEWRLYRSSSARGSVIVGQPVWVRRQAVDDIAQSLLLPLVIALPLSGFLIWLVVGSGLKTLLQLSAQLKKRSPADLRPLPTAELATELMPIAEAMNGLFGRLDAAMTTQRNFIADAAHQLLSPLTALSLLTELLRRPESPAQDSAVRADLHDGVNRLVHLARQLLDLARAAPTPLLVEADTIDLSAVAHDVLEGRCPQFRHRIIELETSRARVNGDFAAMHMAISNLVDNALKYTQPTDRISITVRSNAHHVWLEVSDSGPGVDHAEINRLADRFYRAPGQKIYGSGLGLAIVDEIAQRHQALLTFSSPGRLGGLTVELKFPRYDGDVPRRR